MCALCALIIIKPQEFVPALAGAPLVYIAFVPVLLAIARDRILGRERPKRAPSVLFTSTIGGRVRYRGALADPNELSLMISSAAPFVLVRRAPPCAGKARAGEGGFLRPDPAAPRCPRCSPATRRRCIASPDPLTRACAWISRCMRPV